MLEWAYPTLKLSVLDIPLDKELTVIVSKNPNETWGDDPIWGGNVHFYKSPTFF